MRRSKEESKQGLKYSSNRIGEQESLSEDQSPAAFTLSRRIHTFLDLSPWSFRENNGYQIINYGFAGRNSLHYDAVQMKFHGVDQYKLNEEHDHWGDTLISVSKDMPIEFLILHK